MIPLTPSLLVAAANAFVGLGEDRENRGRHRGPMVELFLREVDQAPGQPWCAAFVYHVGYWSHYDYATKTSSWPLPATASCEKLGEFAEKHGILMEQPMVGDVFLLHSKEKNRFVHTGIVVRLSPLRSRVDGNYMIVCTTVEGNTNADGSVNGYTTLRKLRRVRTPSADRFIRWAKVGYQAIAA